MRSGVSSEIYSQDQEHDHEQEQEEESLRGRFRFIRWNRPSATRAASHKTPLRKRRDVLVRLC
jgi:hypothetical protein